MSEKFWKPNPQALDTIMLNEHVYVHALVENPVIEFYRGRVWDIRREDNGDWEIEVWTNPEEEESAKMEYTCYYFDVYGFPLQKGDKPAVFVLTTRKKRH
jgi:hypothetical protein